MTFKATLSESNLLIDSLSSISEIIDEAVFKITPAGISLVAADRAMVAVADFHLAKSAFEKFEVDSDQAIGLNMSNLLTVLKRSSGKDKLNFNLANNKLQIEITNGGSRKFVVPIIDVTQEEIPQIEQLQFSVKAELNPEILQSGVDDAEIVSDSVTFQATSNKFIMKSEGDLSSAELEIQSGNPNLLSLESGADTKAKYPIDYLKKMIKAARIADSVTVQFGQDYPMKMSFKSGDKASLQFILAPRMTESE
jgi:proliferating cell nuclear antigen